MSSHTPLDCLLGRCDSLRAEVFFRAELPPDVAPDEAVLTGTLSGPDCRHAITLPVTAKLAAVPGSPSGLAAAAATSLVARAILTEPSFWTPELPSLYRLEARLVAGELELATWKRQVGLRRLGVRGRSLWLDGRRHVPRGLVIPPERVDLAAFRAASLATVVADPSEEFLARADAEGVAVLGLLSNAGGQPLDVEAAAAVLRWAWHPAVFAAVLPRGSSAAAAGEIEATTRGRRGTLLVAWEVDGSLPPPEPPAGVDLLLVALPAGAVPHAAWRTEPPSVPLVARRAADSTSATASEPPSRRPCDSLQAALAGWGTAGNGPTPEWAGYVAG